MKMLMYLKRHGDGYFHLHPQHAIFSLGASLVRLNTPSLGSTTGGTSRGGVPYR